MLKVAQNSPHAAASSTQVIGGRPSVNVFRSGSGPRCSQLSISNSTFGRVMRHAAEAENGQRNSTAAANAAPRNENVISPPLSLSSKKRRSFKTCVRSDACEPDPAEHQRYHHRHDAAGAAEFVTMLPDDAWPQVSDFLDEVVTTFSFVCDSCVIAQFFEESRGMRRDEAGI